MKNLIIKISLLLSVLTGTALVSAPVYAAALDCANPKTPKIAVQCGTCQANGTLDNCDPSGAPKTLSDTLKTVIEVISLIAGAVAVIMVIVGGFRYITSAGNPEQAKGARNTILYALVGLVVIALAQIVVHFTLNNVVNDCVNNKTPTGQKC